MMRRRRWRKKIETVTEIVLVVVIMNSFVEKQLRRPMNRDHVNTHKDKEYAAN